MTDFTTLADYGVVGICIALVALVAYIVKIAVNAFNNHVEHNTDALRELTKTMAELREFLMHKNGK